MLLARLTRRFGALRSPERVWPSSGPGRVHPAIWDLAAAVRAARISVAIGAVTAVLAAGCRGAESPTVPMAPSAPRAAAPRVVGSDSAAAPEDAGAQAAGSPGSAGAQAARVPGTAGPQAAAAREATAGDAAARSPAELSSLATAPCTNEEDAGAAATIEGASAPRDALRLTRVAFRELPGWADDNLAEAVPAFVRSCDKLAALPDDDAVGVDGHGGAARQWRRACQAATRLPPGDGAAARAMFEAEFVPYAAAGVAGPVGKLTGYYVAELHAAKTRGGKFQTPVLGRPDDLAMVDLGGFLRDAHGRRIWGRFAQGALVPYYTRAEIRRGALAGRGLELMYVDDPVDLLFAQIEGSAKAVLDDGTTVWLEFAGKNGRAYRGVGGILRGSGLLAPGEGTMLGIRAWFRDHPDRFDPIVDQDASYVFFAVSPQPGAVGSQHTILTARRSIAVDRSFIAMSTPIWVEAAAPVPGKKGVTAPWRQLLIAQDTGAGIRGAVRGDIYWGDDGEAAEIGGRMGGPGKYWLLLPRGVTR